MSTWKKIAIGIIGALVVLCGLFMWFVSWANSDAGQATFKEVETRQAIESATANAQSTKDAIAASNAAGTATAIMAGIDERIKNAKLIYEEELDEGSPFIAANIKDYDLTFEEGAATVSLPWSGNFVWESGKEVTDFIAELDCANYGRGISCGFAYGIHKDGNISRYYASTISGSANCGFFDMTTNFSVSYSPYCAYPLAKQTRLQHLRLEKFGANVRLYVNDKLMDERILEDPKFQTGEVGLLIGRSGGEQSEMNEVRIDHFKIWELP